jgi:hypothetical protein
MHFDSLLWNVSVLEAIVQIFTPSLEGPVFEFEKMSGNLKLR